MKAIILLSLLLQDPGPPPGTVRIGARYIDQTEILNVHWMEYLHFKEAEVDAATYQRLLPDKSNTWYTLPQSRTKPVVLISYEQALDYCAWRSKIISEKTGRTITYRLPTPEEWSAIANDLKATSMKQIRTEIKSSRKIQSKDEPGLASRTAMKKVVYHFFDNVSEMTSDKGVAMGPNNSSLTDDEDQMNRHVAYTGPDRWIGFRCIADE